MGAESRRLQRLEEEAAKRDPKAAVGRTRPSSQELGAADTWDEYFGVWARHGWSKEAVEEEMAFDELVRQRVEASGYEDWMIIGDMIAWFESRNLPYPQMEEALHAYPGPKFWAGGEGGS